MNALCFSPNEMALTGGIQPLCSVSPGAAVMPQGGDDAADTPLHLSSSTAATCSVKNLLVFLFCPRQSETPDMDTL